MIRPVTPADLPALLALNNAHAAELSWLEPAALARLVASCWRATRVGADDAFMLALDQGADYASPNYRWLCARLPRFVYVDRLAVAARARGRGLARALYADLTAAARDAGHDTLACEVNLDPPNPGSLALHAALGFTPIGDRVIPGRVVRYFTKRIDADPVTER